MFKTGYARVKSEKVKSAKLAAFVVKRGANFISLLVC